jgi:uncharacterized protein YndB with AHSA1/START domain
MRRSGDGLVISRALRIRSPPERVLAAFFDPGDLTAWWDVSQAIVVPRTLGPFAVQWPITTFKDAELGRLGGTLHGIVMEFREGAGFLLADVYYTPPDTEPVGPMALEIAVRPVDDGLGTEVAVRQSGDGDGPRWRRYFALMGEGWQRALEALRAHLERSAVRPHRGHTWEPPA